MSEGDQIQETESSAHPTYIMLVEDEITKLRAEVTRLTAREAALVEALREAKQAARSLGWRAVTSIFSAEVARLTAREKQLVEALRLYGEHSVSCPAPVRWLEMKTYGCSCGLQAVLGPPAGRGGTL